MASHLEEKEKRSPSQRANGDALVSTALDRTAETARSVKEDVQTAAERVKETLTEVGDKEKKFAAERIEQLAEAVHGAADQLGAQLPGASTYIHDAAAGLQRASSSLQNASVEDALASLNKFAREQPALLFGGAILAGISLSRFLKSSAHRPRG
jgi:hypothetical protein